MGDKPGGQKTLLLLILFWSTAQGRLTLLVVRPDVRITTRLPTTL